MTTILIVDNDSAIRGLMAKLLSFLGYAVMAAGNGLEAVDVFCSNAERIDLILTDLRMPVMDGYEAVAQIWKLKPTARIVCMSASPGAHCPAGASFLPKPFTVQSVRECIGRAMLNGGAGCLREIA